MYSLFLSPKGKIVADCFVVKMGHGKAEEEEFWIDVDSGRSQALLEHFRKYTWKKQV
jgi:folate-binding Fe-S cluster repair protein YgfZ